MWYSILARSVRNDFLFPGCKIVGIVISSSRSSPRKTASVFLCDGIRHIQFNSSRFLHNKKKEIFTRLNLVRVSFFDAEKSGRRNRMKSVRDPPDR